MKPTEVRAQMVRATDILDGEDNSVDLAASWLAREDVVAAAREHVRWGRLTDACRSIPLEEALAGLEEAASSGSHARLTRGTE